MCVPHMQNAFSIMFFSNPVHRCFQLYTNCFLCVRYQLARRQKSNTRDKCPRLSVNIQALIPDFHFFIFPIPKILPISLFLPTKHTFQDIAFPYRLKIN